MWGDDKRDYRTFKRNDYGLSVVVLPDRVSLYCGCSVDVRWLFCCGDMYASGCIAESAKTCGDHHKSTIEDTAKSVAKELYSRYEENCIPKES